LLAWQNDDGLAVLNVADPEVAGWKSLVKGDLRSPRSDEVFPSLSDLTPHDRRNAALAATAARAVGCGEHAILAGLRSCGPLPHRLRYVGEIADRKIYDDSKSTTPEATVAALEAVPQPAWFLVGGKDKGGDYEILIDALVDRARGACFFGTVGPRLMKVASKRSDSRDPKTVFHCEANLVDAVKWIVAHSQPRDAIVLSPGCSSHDQFRDYAHRATTFVESLRAVQSCSRRQNQLASSSSIR